MNEETIHTQEANRKFVLSIAVLVAFTIMTLIVLASAFCILTGGIKLQDPATVGIVTGIIGTMIGYSAAMAQQVSGYYFGSSSGSAAKDKALAEASTGGIPS